MRRHEWIKVIAVLLLVIFFDQYTKNIAQSKPETWYGPIHWILIHNHGAMLGLFSNLTIFLRVVTLSTAGFFILSIYFFLQYIIPNKVMPLRYGLSFLVGGIIGNVLDRTIYGYVIDFISIQVFGWHSPIWNVADMIQWVGYFMISYALIKFGHLFWPDKNSRKGLFVNKSFQINFMAFFISVGLFLSLISFVFSYTYLKLSLKEIAGSNIELIDKYAVSFIFSFLTLLAVFAMTLYVIAKRVSHRIAGPVFAFERYIKFTLEANEGNPQPAPLKLRAGDNFRHLEKTAIEFTEKINTLKENQIKISPTMSDASLFPDQNEN